MGDIKSVKLSPMLLIPFVENAIKHGINPQHKSVIDILIEIRQNHLYYKVTNPVIKNMNGILDNSSGFGLDNLKKRLPILYPDTCTIETKRENEYFIATLSIQLN